MTRSGEICQRIAMIRTGRRLPMDSDARPGRRMVDAKPLRLQVEPRNSLCLLVGNERWRITTRLRHNVEPRNVTSLQANTF